VELQATLPPADEHVFLTGRPPMGEFLGFVTGQSVGGQAQEMSALADRWRRANDHIHNLEVREAGWADSPTLGSIPTEQQTLRDSVLADPMYRRSFQIVPAEISIVELDRLVVFQKHINLEYVARLKRDLGSEPSPDRIFKFCLPFDHPQPPVTSGQITQNAFMFVSPSTDLRLLEVAPLSAAQLTNYTSQGPVSGVVAMVVGFGSNFLNVIHAENRLVLNNGSHRAYALRDLGITHVPGIVQHVTRRDELEVIAPGDLSTKPDLYLREPRPPLLKDYFDPALRSILPVPRRNRQVKVMFGAETLDVPAT
jgi:hypothetical protein